MLTSKVKVENIRKVVFTSKKLSLLIAQLASDKKATDIVILDMKKVANFCDYFVICSGNTDRQVRAIADYIADELVEKGISSSLRQKSRPSDWVVFDTGDVVVHIFQKKAREFYNIEYLWQEAKVVPFSEDTAIQ